MGERISRLMDSDLDDAAAEAAFQDLKRPDGVDTWVCYHVIGDALRRTTDPTPGFGARFAARSIAALPGAAMRAGGGLLSAFGRSASTVASLTAPVLGLALALGPIGVATVGIAQGFRAVKKSVSEAAEMQGLQTSFITLLGGAKAAQFSGPV